MPPDERAAERGLHSGHLLALGGALIALGSLWAPWLKLAASPAAVNGWQMLHGLDIAVAAGAGAAILVLLGATGVFGAFAINLNSAGRTCFVIGLAGTVAVGHWVLWRVPLPGTHAGWGQYACLAACAAVTIGAGWAALTSDPGHNQLLDELFAAVVEGPTDLFD
jgi:hypothetical protein